VQNSYFYGGGNGAVSGGIKWKNCTFDNIVDGTEADEPDETWIYDSIFNNIHSSEIDLQDNVRFDFVGCTFQGVVNLDNGTARLTNSTFLNNLATIDLGDNKGGDKASGTMYQFWNFSSGMYVEVQTDWNKNLNVSINPNPILSAKTLTFTISAPAKTDSVTLVYVAAKGKPQVKINGNLFPQSSTWLFDSTSKMLTINWGSSYPEIVTLNW
jgi:hypothetical protein